MSKRVTNRDLIDRATKKHNGKYDYSKVNYINNRTKITIVCPVHGEFQKLSSEHLAGSGCQKCAFEDRAAKKRKPVDQQRLKHPLYSTWKGMRQRCYKEWHHAFHNYGGRGIKVCKRWECFDRFVADMGERPEGMTLDRIDNNGDYTPENCRWATKKEQSINKRNAVFIESDGVRYTAKYIARNHNLNYECVVRRIKRGLSFSEVIKPIVSN